MIHPAGSCVESVEDLEVARFRACLYEVKKQKRIRVGKERGEGGVEEDTT